MASFEYRMPVDTPEAELLALVQQLNNDPQVHGILVQLPLPDHLDEDLVINAIALSASMMTQINAGTEKNHPTNWFRTVSIRSGSNPRIRKARTFVNAARRSAR